MKIENAKKVRGILMLLFVAIIWGLAFVAQKSEVQVKPFTFNCIRYFFSTFALVVFLGIKKLIDKKNGKVDETTHEEKKNLWIGGILIGVALFLAAGFQQYGIAGNEDIGLDGSSTDKAGFLTSLYLIFTPIIGFLFCKKKIGINIIISVVLAVVGFYLMCMVENLSIGTGELLVFISSIFFAVQIIVIDKYAQNVDGVKVSCIQFGTVTLLSFIPMLFEAPTWDGILTTLPNLLYVGFISGCLGFTIQILAQKDVGPTTTSLILSLESVFSLIFTMLLMKQMLSLKEAIGAALIFLAVVNSQLSYDFIKPKKSHKK